MSQRARRAAAATACHAVVLALAPALIAVPWIGFSLPLWGWWGIHWWFYGDDV